MSKEFEEIVLQKLKVIDEIKDKLFDLDEMRQKVSKIDEIEKKVSKIDEIEQKVSKIDGIEQKLEKVSKDVETLKETMEVVKGSVIKLEKKVNTEFPALYEVYDLNYALQKENVQRVNSLEINSNDFSIRIENLEKIAKDHSEKLKKLISQS